MMARKSGNPNEDLSNIEFETSEEVAYFFYMQIDQILMKIFLCFLG